MIAVNDVFVDGVFEMARTVRKVEETLSVRIIFCKEQLGRAITIQPPLGKLDIIEFDKIFARAA